MSSLKQHIQNIKTIGLITSIWIAALFLYFDLIYITRHVVQPEVEIKLIAEFIQIIIIALGLGLLNGIFEVYIYKNIFKKMPFFLVTVTKTFFFVLAFVLTVTIVFFLNPLEHKLPENMDNLWGRLEILFSLFFRIEMIAHLTYSVIISFGINFFLQVNRKMGKGVLYNLFFGKYHSPREEKRIIQFLDLKSSTLIAERLSPQEYSLFIKDFFFDIDSAIEETKGAVFQFVGDEVVILWNEKEGIENNNCIRFIFLVQKKINSERQNYLDKYGIVPEFKAGVHYGSVIVTEVGGSKQEIAYHGDVMNTAARIRSYCTEIDKNFLISADLLSILPELDEDFDVESAGVCQLKGKENIIGLFSLAEK
jgi:adenylate cyclase